MTSFNEKEILIASIKHLLKLEINAGISISELTNVLRYSLMPTGEDLIILKGRNDDKFSQKVRNLVSHKRFEETKAIIFKDNKFYIENHEILKKYYIYNIAQLPIQRLNLSKRIKNGLTDSGLITVEDLLNYSPFDIARTPGLGKKSLNEIKNTFQDLNINYGEPIEANFLRNNEFEIKEDAENLSNLFLPVGILKLSVRSENVINSIGCELLGDIVILQIKDILKYQNAGIKTVREINDQLKKYNLALEREISNWYEIKESHKPHNSFQKLYKVSETELYEKLLGELREKEKEIIIRRYENLETLETAGDHFKVTRERIRQIEAKSLKKLNHLTLMRPIQDLLEDKKQVIWKILSSNSPFYKFDQNMPSLVKISKDKKNAIYDLCIDVLFKRRKDYLHNNFEYSKSKNIFINSKFNAKEILNFIDNELDFLLETLPLPVSIDSLYENLIEKNSDLLLECIKFIETEGKYILYRGFFFRSKNNSLNNNLGRKVFTRAIDTCIHFHENYQKKIIRKKDSIKDIYEIKSLYHGVNNYLGSRSEDLRRVFDRGSIEHFYHEFDDSFYLVGQLNKFKKYYDDISLLKESPNEQDIGEQEIDKKDDSENKYKKIIELICLILNEHKILDFQSLNKIYADKIEGNPFKTSRLLSVFLNNNILFEKISPTLWGLKENDNLSIFKSHFLKNHKFYGNKENNSLLYEIDYYSLSRFASEPHSIFPLYSYELEEILFDYLITRDSSNKREMNTLHSFISITSPEDWTNINLANKAKNKKLSAKFSLLKNNPVKPNLKNDINNIKKYKLYNIIKLSLYCSNRDTISALSANKCLQFSQLKFHFSIITIGLMGIIGLWKVPDDFRKAFTVNKEKLKEFNQIIEKDLLIYKFKNNKEFSWSTKTGKWFLKNYLNNLENFKTEKNYITQIYD